MEQHLFGDVTLIELIRALSAGVGGLVVLAMAVDGWRFMRRARGMRRRALRFRLWVELCGIGCQIAFLAAALNAMATPEPVLAAVRQTALTNGVIYLLAQNAAMLASVLGAVNRRAVREWEDEAAGRAAPPAASG